MGIRIENWPFKMCWSLLIWLPSFFVFSPQISIVNFWNFFFNYYWIESSILPLTQNNFQLCFDSLSHTCSLFFLRIQCRTPEAFFFTINMEIETCNIHKYILIFWSSDYVLWLSLILFCLLIPLTTNSNPLIEPRTTWIY